MQHANVSMAPRLLVLLILIFLGACSSKKVGEFLLDDFLQPSDTPDATFTVSVNSGNAPLIVDFQDTSDATPGGFTYHWVFGDGETATGQTVSHTYMDPGVYSALLNISSIVTSSTVSSSSPVTITVLASPSPAMVPPVTSLEWTYERKSQADFDNSPTTARYTMIGVLLTAQSPSVTIVNRYGETEEFDAEYWPRIQRREPKDSWPSRDSKSRFVYLSSEVIEVPAGVFDCRVIEQTFEDGSRTTRWLHPDLCCVRRVRHEEDSIAWTEDLVSTTLQRR
ncbi:MAG: PKD domain-containing protein [Planctomycetota bacterium]